MKSGKVIKCFTANDGRKVILRTPRWEDLDDFFELINSLIEEGADIMMPQIVTRAEEADWLGRTLANLEKDDEFGLVAEVNGSVVANSALRKKSGYSSHVGELGIIIKKGFRDVGIGTEMLKNLISRAKTIGLEILTLRVFSSNERAFHVYEKLGFKEAGRISNGLFKNGKYLDDILMVRRL
ncbi:MAG: GNAT family N-acetyltransferase [Candidatus Bathyarchaeia archaeon]